MNNDLEIQREAIIEIVGTQYEGRAVNHFGLNEHQKLIIKHQPDNSHDSNAVMILTEDGKELGFIPKGYASIYAPAIESNRYSFSAEVVKTEQDPYRPILIIKVIAEYNSNGEEETEKSIIELVKDIVDGFASAKEKYNDFIYSDTVDVNALAATLNKARLMYKLFQRSSDLMTDIIKDNHIIENSSSDKQLSADSLKETVCDLKEDVRNILKKIQKEYNEAYELEIDNEDEYLRVQTEMRGRRKKFRAYDGMLNSFIEAIEGYDPISDHSSELSENLKATSSDNNIDISEVAEQEQEPITEPTAVSQNNENSLKTEPSVTDGAVLVDYDLPKRCSGSKPCCFIFYGSKYNVDTWKELYTGFLKLLYYHNTFGNILKGLQGKSMNNNRIDFAYRSLSRHLRSKIMISQDFYAEGNLSAVDIIKRIKWLMTLCDIPNDQMAVYYIGRADSAMSEGRCSDLSYHEQHKSSVEKASDFTKETLSAASDKSVQETVQEQKCNDEMVDFSRPYDYVGYRPYRFIYNGDEFPAKNWIDLYKKVLMLVYTTDEKSKKLIQANYNKAIYHGMVIFSPTEKSPFRTGSLWAADGLYIEKNLSFGEVIKRIEFVMTLCGIPKEKIEIYCLARSARNTAEDSFEERPESEKDEQKEIENVQTDNDKDERAAAEQIIAEAVSPGFKPDLSKSFSLKEALVEILSSDAPEINQYKNEKNGICVDDFIKILKKYYKKSKERFVISRRLIEDDDFRSVGLEYYTLSDRKLSSLSKNEKTQPEYIPADEHSQPAPAPSKELTAELIADIIKENCGELQYKDGFGTYEIKNLLARKGVTGISEDAIETLMPECPQLKEIEDGYYMPREAEDKPSLSKQESYPKEEAVSESIADDRHIILKINGEPVRAYDCSEALVKACEFAINCRPFKMARIAGQDITLNGERVFYRRSIPVEGYNKLSNELQVMPVSRIDDLKMVIDKIKDYCQIDDSMITVISR